MSMLAERKRKQKWSLNPRGNEWAQDANKFGQKMLEKMGWQHGKGLGAKENGITEHVKISYKNDSKGMGYKETNNQWTEHDANFNALLESLTCEGEKREKMKMQSLEKKSQTSRARVHYHKFTRGKDLSRYSEKDLANIFGKKTLKADLKKEPVIEEDETRNESGYLFNGGSMRDYFKKKIPGFSHSNRYVVGQNGVLKKEESDSEGELRTSFGFGFKNEVNSTPESLKKDSEYVSHVAENTLSKRKAENEVKEENLFSPMKKLKTEGKQKKNCDENLGLSNPAFNPMSTPVKVQKHVLEPIEESISEETLDMEVGKIVTTEAEVHMEHAALNTPPPKQKRKSKGTFDEILVENTNDSSAFETPSEKKKKYKNKESGILNINFDSIQENKCTQVEENPYTLKMKKSKNNEEAIKTEVAVKFKSKSKNKRNSSQQNEFDNLNFNHTEDNSTGSGQFEDNPYEVKLKRKKKKERNLDFDNPNFEDYENTPIDPLERANNLYEIKLKKKKKKKEKSQYLNPSFNDSQELSISSLQIQENPYEVKVKGKKEKSKTIMEMKELVNIKSKKKKNKGNRGDKETTSISDQSLNLNESKDSIEDSSVCIEGNDLILNIACTPVKTRANNNNDESRSVSEVHSDRRRKSVRFSDITKELIIPNNEDLQRICNGEEVASMTERFGKIKNGLDNICFDKQKNRLDENIETISKTLDQYQAEIENDINEGKLKTVTMDNIMVGEVGNPHGENERLPNGSTKLKFKYADLNARTSYYHMANTGAKKSYKHLIKGDIILKFNNSNLHEVVGYAKKKKKKVM